MNVKTRRFTKDQLEISQLGFGCMRFPIIDNDNSKIDEKKAMKMIRTAIDKGVNYIDTAYNYHGGNSEKFLKKALADGYREKIYLADKLPVWKTDTYSSFFEHLDEQLERCGTEYFDFYLLHSLHRKTWNKAKELNVLKFLDEAKAKGKIKYAGFSFHDAYPIFEDILNSYDWDFCQIQLNYLDTEYQAGLKGLYAATEKDIDVVIMEPIKGGKLAFPPNEIRECLEESGHSPAAMALRWVWNYPEVKVVLSGMSTMDQVLENIKTASISPPNSLTSKETLSIEKAKSFFEERTKVSCTTCEYCMPCPFGVNIPRVFEIYNAVFLYDLEEENKQAYLKLVENEMGADKCTQCGQCESICPQHISIIEKLEEAHDFLTK